MYLQASLLLASQDTLIIQRNFIKILAFKFESYLLIYGKSVMQWGLSSPTYSVGIDTALWAFGASPQLPLSPSL